MTTWKPEDDDPADWPSAEWRQFDQLLRCPICKDLCESTLLLQPCQHNFCSLCLRTALDQQRQVTKQCPCCRSPVHDLGRQSCPNRILDDLIRLFRQIRRPTMDALKLATAQPLKPNDIRHVQECDRNEEEINETEMKQHTAAAVDAPSTPKITRHNPRDSLDDDDFQERSHHPISKFRKGQQTTPRLTRSRAREESLSQPQQQQQHRLSPPPFMLMDDIAVNRDRDPKRARMECPVCAREFPATTELEMGRHVESCLSNPPPQESRGTSKRARSQLSSVYNGNFNESSGSVIAQSSKTTTQWMNRPPVPMSSGRLKRHAPAPKRREPMKKVWYSGMKDRNLRDLLAKCGLPIHGDRKTLEKRHSHFINVWNAACDGNSNRTDKELVQQVMDWERTTTSNHNTSSSWASVTQQHSHAQSSSKNGHDIIMAHLTKYKAEFDELIQQVRERQQLKREQEEREKEQKGTCAQDADTGDCASDSTALPDLNRSVDENIHPSQQQQQQQQQQDTCNPEHSSTTTIGIPAPIKSPLLTVSDEQSGSHGLGGSLSWLDDLDSAELFEFTT